MYTATNDTTYTATTDAANLADALKTALLFAAKNDARYYLQGAMVRIGTAGRVVVYATDGHTALRISMAAPVVCSDSEAAPTTEVIISTDAAKLLLQHPGLKQAAKAKHQLRVQVTKDKDGQRLDVHLCGTDHQLAAFSEQHRELIDGRYPDVDRLYNNAVNNSGEPGAPMCYQPAYLERLGKAYKVWCAKDSGPRVHSQGAKGATWYTYTTDEGVAVDGLVMPLRD